MALKNDEAGVQMHFVFGSEALVKSAMELAAPDEARVLKIVQRMRMEPTQLEGVERKMADESEFCMLLAVACGINAQDYRKQTHSLRESFIKYLQEKQAAGIVNVNYLGDQEQPAYVVHIFPPGPFATAKLKHYADDLYSNLFPQPNSETPHLLVVVTTV
ncbi:hypothetical protein BOX15_Mlig015882g1 [Macrostomum lignano]|nr:hypothetical protein BOX15_Mlig015882g1 [Macrostomum lignano]